jgi:hypothetical protein
MIQHFCELYDSPPPDGEDRSGWVVTPSALLLKAAPPAEASAASLAARAASSLARSII